MKSIYTYIIALIAGIVLNSCSDDDSIPQLINEDEVITTVRVQLANDIGIITTFESLDTDGDGPNPPEVTVSGPLTANTMYTGTVSFFNDTISPPDNITAEVEEESDEHQVFFTPASGLNLNTAYGNFDNNGNPLGTFFTLTTSDASAGNFTITLRHEPTKPNDGLADAGGDTDVEVTFSVTIQ